MHQQIPLSGWWRRVAAFLCDLVLAGAVAFCVLVLGGAVTGQQDQPAFVAAFWLIILLYSPLLASRGGARNGQTIGRQLVGIRIVREDGRELRFGRAFGRHLAHLVIAVLPFVNLLNDLWPLWDPKRQTVHDKIAETLVAVAGQR